MFIWESEVHIEALLIDKLCCIWELMVTFSSEKQSEVFLFVFLTSLNH